MKVKLLGGFIHMIMVYNIVCHTVCDGYIVIEHRSARKTVDKEAHIGWLPK